MSTNRTTQQSRTLDQITQLYALSHQELFEVVKMMAFQTTAICHRLQGATTDLSQDELTRQALDYAAGFMPEAREEAKHMYRPTGWTDARQ